MPYAGNLDFKFPARFCFWLTPFGSRSKRQVAYLFFTVNALCWYRDLKFSARFGSWLTHFVPGVSALALTLFSEIVNALCWYSDFKISARFGSWLTAFGTRSSAPGVSAKSLTCFELIMPYAGNLDFQISGRFRFWLTPFDPGVSA